MFWSRVTSIKDSYKLKLDVITGVINSTFIAPFGLYSKPKKGTKAITIKHDNNANSTVTIPLHDGTKLLIKLHDDDVILTDNKSFIHFKYKDGGIDIKSKTINCEFKTLNLSGTDVNIKCSNFLVEASSIELKGSIKSTGALKNNGVNCGSTHIHKGNLNAPTTPPIN